MVEWQGKGGWPPDLERWPLFVPSEVRGATLGIIGYGSIGREIARIAKTAFSMTILACKRDPSRHADEGYALPGTGDPEGRFPDAWFPPEKLMDLLARSDVVVNAAPLTRETERMINARALAAMKPSAYFINVGRGASVDEAALARALAEKRIAGAAIDVFAQEPPPAGHPLYAWGAPGAPQAPHTSYTRDNLILSPHVSGFLPSYDDKCTDLFAENLRRFLAGAPLLNLVDRAKGY
jgi:phosphoglycerate dehydrogenase-like enzyme